MAEHHTDAPTPDGGFWVAIALLILPHWLLALGLAIHSFFK